MVGLYFYPVGNCPWWGVVLEPNDIHVCTLIIPKQTPFLSNTTPYGICHGNQEILQRWVRHNSHDPHTLIIPKQILFHVPLPIPPHPTSVRFMLLG